MIDERAFEIARGAEVAAVLCELGEKPEARVRLDIAVTLGEDGVRADRVHAAADTGIAVCGGHDGIGALHGRVAIARMERRTDAEAALDADDPCRLGEVALLIQDRVVEPHREPVDAAAGRAVERHLEELTAARILKALRVVRRAVEISERARVAQDDRQAKDEREILVDADVGAHVEDAHRLAILGDVLGARHEVAGGEPGLK